MKKIFALSAIIAVISAPAIAVQKCVALGRTTTCTAGITRPGNYEWSLSCTTDRTSVTVSGIGICSSVSGTAGEVRSTLKSTGISTATNPNTCVMGDAVHCWCRMVSPAVSQWVYSGLEDLTESNCIYNCASNCAYYIANESILTTAMFSTSTFSD